jgi:hypothetical protein
MVGLETIGDRPHVEAALKSSNDNEAAHRHYQYIRGANDINSKMIALSLQFPEDGDSPVFGLDIEWDTVPQSASTTKGIP